MNSCNLLLVKIHINKMFGALQIIYFRVVINITFILAFQDFLENCVGVMYIEF